MKVIIILDQIQAGLGGKERADTPYGGKKIAMGIAENVEKLLIKNNSEIIGTFYCGTQYYQDHRTEVLNKFTKMAEKMQADVVIAGPTFDYPEFAQMSGEITEYFRMNSDIPIVSAMAQEKNQDVIDRYKDDNLILKMPKKGGAGLADSLENLVVGCELLAGHADMTKFKADFCY